MSFIKGESLLDLVPNDVKPWCYGEWYKCLKSRYCSFDMMCRENSDPCNGRTCPCEDIGGCDYDGS